MARSPSCPLPNFPLPFHLSRPSGRIRQRRANLRTVDHQPCHGSARGGGRGCATQGGAGREYAVQAVRGSGQLPPSPLPPSCCPCQWIGRLALLSSLTRLVQGCRRQGRGGPRLVAESAPARAAVAPEKLPLCPYLPLSACAEAQYPILKRARLADCLRNRRLHTQVPMQMTAEQLRPTFDPFGNVEEVSIIHDKVTHLSKGTPPLLPAAACPDAHAMPEQKSPQAADGRGGGRSCVSQDGRHCARLTAAHETPPPPSLPPFECAHCRCARRLWLRHLLHRGGGPVGYRHPQ